MTDISYNIEYLDIARTDISNIVYYVSHNLKNKNAAIKLADAILNEINNIKMFPYANPEYKLTKKLNNIYRKSKVKKFLLDFEYVLF